MTTTITQEPGLTRTTRIVQGPAKTRVVIGRGKTRAVIGRNKTRIVHGMRGPPGVSGGAVALEGFVFTQSSPATVWTINHNLGRYPLISVRSVGGLEIDAEILYLNNNQVQVTFTDASIGSARLI